MELCAVGTEFLIFVKEVRFENTVGNVHHKIYLGNDGSVFTKEVLVTPSKDEILHTSTSGTFQEFSEKFPEHAKIIRDFVNRKMLTIPGMDKRCDL